MTVSTQISPQAIYRTPDLRQIEQLAASGPHTPALMEKAGLAAAELARDQLLAGGKASVLILAGPGNNGGDALVAARYLKQWWFKITVVFTGKREKLAADARKAHDDWLAAGGKVLTEIPAGGKWDAIIDGLFGIGLERDLEARYLQLVNELNRMGLPVLSIDIPSGLCSDTGKIRGVAVHAAATVTFIALKSGLFTNFGPEYCGEIFLRTLDVDAPRLRPPRMWLIDRTVAGSPLKPRPANSHKGMFGSVGIVGGAPSMVGAALLAGRAALKLGAGRIYLGLLAPDAPGADVGQPELMLRSPHALMKLSHLSCLVVGPGMGDSTDARYFLKSALESRLPLAIDADALNLIGAHPELQQLLTGRANASILTPHPAEAARLLDVDTAHVQNDRIAAAVTLAERYNSHVVLKGAGSICALPNGECFINTTGNPGLASAGMGDVLCGMLGAFLAQGLSPQHTMLLAVYLHGAAADELVKQGIGPVGLTASEVTDAARGLLNQWIYRQPE